MEKITEPKEANNKIEITVKLVVEQEQIIDVTTQVAKGEKEICKKIGCYLK